MSKNNKIKDFSAADIEKYHKSLLSFKERNELEKAALDDPFLADALEGYATAGINISEDITELNKRLTEKTESSKVIPLAGRENSSFAWWRVAAAVLLIAGAGFLVYQFTFNKKPKEIAENKQETTTPDSNQNSLVQKTDIIPESKESKTETKNQTRVSVSNETIGSGMSRTKADTAIIQSLNTQPLSKSPSKEIVAKQNPKNEESNTEAIAKNEMKIKSSNDNNNLDETVVVKKMADKNLDRTKEQVYTANGYALNKINSLSKRFIDDSVHNNIFKGRITDINNNPLPFANITNTEDSVGTYADAKGYFTLTSTDSVMNVRVQSLGFNNAVTQLRSDISTNNLTLHEDKSISALVLTRKKPNASRFGESSMKLQEPEPADGWDNYDTYLANNLKIPETIRMKQTRGEVEVSFDVDENGDPINIKVEKSLCNECDKEAIRLIKKGPKWIRHSKNGKTRVTVSF